MQQCTIFCINKSIFPKSSPRKLMKRPDPSALLLWGYIPHHVVRARRSAGRASLWMSRQQRTMLKEAEVVHTRAYTGQKNWYRAWWCQLKHTETGTSHVASLHTSRQLAAQNIPLALPLRDTCLCYEPAAPNQGKPGVVPE